MRSPLTTRYLSFRTGSRIDLMTSSEFLRSADSAEPIGLMKKQSGSVSLMRIPPSQSARLFCGNEFRRGEVKPLNRGACLFRHIRAALQVVVRYPHLVTAQNLDL